MAKPASAAVINPGESLWTSMTACWPMLEGTGTTSADKAGTRTLTFAGGGTPPVWSTESGGDACISIGTALSSPLTPATSLTIPANTSWSVAWRAKQSADDNQGAVLGDGTTSSFISMFGGANYLGVRDSSGNDFPNYTQASFTAEDNWVFVFDDAYNGGIGGAFLYKNGVQVSTGSFASFPFILDRIGNGYSSTTFALVGTVSYVYVWSGTALSAADASALNTNPYFGLTTDPVVFVTPTRGEISRSITLTVGGYASTWLSESTSGLFTVSGGTGASITNVQVLSDTEATVTLNPGTALGTLTITDTSTAATTTFDVINCFAGGILSTSFSSDAGLSGSDATGRTFINLELTQRIRQHGPITQVRAYISAVDGTDGVRFKVFRPNGTNFDYVSQSELLTPVGTGVQTFNLASPMACQPGDLVGVWLKSNNTLGVKTATLTPAIKWDAGNQTGANWNPGNSVNNFNTCLDFRTAFVTCVDTGDSRSAGHNGATYWYTHYETGPAGLITAQPIHHLQELIDATRTDFTYQNFAKGSQTWEHVSGTQFPDIFTTYGLTPKYVWTQCGVNDVAAGRTNSAILADLDTCYALLPANTTWFIDEVLPWTAGSDLQAAALRSLNTAIAAWAVGKDNVVIVSCFSAMGQTRVSTGQPDDMLAAYDYDAVHMTTPAGVTALATLRLVAYDAAQVSPGTTARNFSLALQISIGI